MGHYDDCYEREYERAKKARKKMANYEPIGVKGCRPSSESAYRRTTERKVRDLRARVKELETAFKRHAGHKEECLYMLGPEYGGGKECDCGYQKIRDSIKTSR